MLRHLDAVQNAGAFGKTFPTEIGSSMKMKGRSQKHWHAHHLEQFLVDKARKRVVANGPYGQAIPRVCDRASQEVMLYILVLSYLRVYLSKEEGCVGASSIRVREYSGCWVDHSFLH